jgi:hypothetical protein
MSFGKDSSFVFVMQEGKLVNIGRRDDAAAKQPFDSIEEEVWRIFGEWKHLQAENKRLREALDQVIYRLHKIAESPVLRRKIIQRNNWITATREIAEQALQVKDDNDGKDSQTKSI